CSAENPSSTPTLCINSELTAITIPTSGAPRIGTPTGLPTGVSASWAVDTITLTGTPTASGVFNYIIPLEGNCGVDASATGRITVIPENTVGAASATPSLCLNTVLTNITHTTTGATGIGSATGLPAGVTANWSSNTITISGTPTNSGVFNYTIPLTGGCGNINATGTITVVEENTVSAGPATNVCLDSVITDITLVTGGASGIGTASGLPAGLTASWASNTITISGTPTVTGTFNYTIPLTGGCGSVNATGTITVITNNTVSVASSAPTLCLNTALTNITHTTTGATGIGIATGLPAGVTVNWASNTITISGTPTEVGTFNYSIPITGGCGTVNATGTITVTPINTVSAASSSQSLCLNTALTNITHTTTGATGVGTATGLPAGVTASWVSNTITISGTPTESGIFAYTIPLTGGCGTVNATGTITVTTNNSVTSASTAPTLCLNTTLTNITHTTTGATGIGSASGLPAGVTASWASNTITISGTPTVSGTFNYTIPLTGGCSSINATGTIIVNPENTVIAVIADSIACLNAAMTSILYTTTGATGIGASTGLPTGVSAGWIANTITISGSPTVSGTFNYTIPLTGGCGTVNVTGTISVKEIISEKISIHDKSGLTDDDGIICFGESVLLTAKGGASYLWSNGDTAAFLILSPLTTTDYSVTITSNDGCTVVEKATVKVNASPAPTVTTTNPDCPQSQTGTATASVGSGWTYLWSNGSSTPVITGLVQGLYALTVTDANGCEGSTSANLVDQSLPMTINASKTDVICQGASTGTITVNVNGGGQPYSYTWSANAGGSTSNILSGLKGGNYSVTVTEGGVYKCKVVSTVEISEPEFGVQAVISLKENSGITSDDGIICQTDLATLSVNATANPGASIVSYLWNDAAASTTSSIQVGTTNTYKVTVTDSKGCSTEASQLISVVSENTVTTASSAPTLCLNTTLTNITHTTTGATGIGTATGLPAGVTASWASNTITISGTPTVSGTFNYAIPLTGGCTSLNATGTIIVNPENTVTVAIADAVTCVNTAMSDIIYTTTGATGIGTSTGLPTGVSAGWIANTITISGTPTVSGTFNYTIPLTGGCGTVNVTGTISVKEIISEKISIHDKSGLT
ncbi:MAG: beta strand repeat-containing protein, partial [Bacteroidota bacterium]